MYDDAALYQGASYGYDPSNIGECWKMSGGNGVMRLP